MCDTLYQIRTATAFQRRILSRASISELLFRNAFKLMDNQGLVAPGDQGLAARRNAIALELRDLRLRLRRIRAMAVTARGQRLQPADQDVVRIAKASNQ